MEKTANAKSLGNLCGSHSCRSLNPLRAGSCASLGLGLPALWIRVLSTVCLGLSAILCIRLCIPARVHIRVRLPSGVRLSTLRIHLPTLLCIWLPAIWGLRLRRIWPAALVGLAPPLVVTRRAETKALSAGAVQAPASARFQRRQCLLI